MGIIASLECVPTVVLIVFQPYLTCLSHLHWEVSPLLCPSADGVSGLCHQPAGGQLAQCHRECQRSSALHPHPSCSPPAAGRGKQCLQTQSRAGPWQAPRVGYVRALPAPSGTCRYLERGTNKATTRGSALRGTVQTTRLTPAEIGPRGCQCLSPHCCCWISWFSDGNCRLTPAPGPPTACEGPQ